MHDGSEPKSFPTLNRAYNAVFQPGRLSIGLVLPLERYAVSALPDMSGHIERAQMAEALGFSALWLRDVPFNVPSFGDVGQIYDPFVYLGALSGATQDIALGVASIILPLRHPAHVAKAAASADVLSGGRLLLGVASGDRPEEYPAMNMSFPDRGARFQDSFRYIRDMAQSFPTATHDQGHLSGQIDMIPKPQAGRIPMLITGGSQQPPDWVAEHGDGWMTYPRDPMAQKRAVDDYRTRVAKAGGPPKPVMQSLYVDLLPQADAEPRPIHLGFASGSRFLLSYLREIEGLGINHVALNLRFSSRDIDTVLKQLSEDVLPGFAPERT